METDDDDQQEPELERAQDSPSKPTGSNDERPSGPETGATPTTAPGSPTESKSQESAPEDKQKPQAPSGGQQESTPEPRASDTATQNKTGDPNLDDPAARRNMDEAWKKTPAIWYDDWRERLWRKQAPWERYFYRVDPPHEEPFVTPVRKTPQPTGDHFGHLSDPPHTVAGYHTQISGPQPGTGDIPKAVENKRPEYIIHGDLVTRCNPDGTTDTFKRPKPSQ